MNEIKIKKEYENFTENQAGSLFHLSELLKCFQQASVKQTSIIHPTRGRYVQQRPFMTNFHPSAAIYVGDLYPSCGDSVLSISWRTDPLNQSAVRDTDGRHDEFRY